MYDTLLHLWNGSGLTHLDWRMLVMWGVAVGLLYLAVGKGFEPLLLVPIAFGALLANLPTEGLVNPPPQPIRTPVAGRVLEVNVKVHQELVGDTAANDRFVIARIQPLEVVRGEDGVLTFALDDSGQPKVATDDGGAPLPPIDLFNAAAGTVVAIPAVVGQTIWRQDVVVDVEGETPGGLFHYLSQGIHLEIFPPLIFLGVGALTDFGPLIANPKVLLLGAAAQLGIFVTFLGALALGFSPGEAASIGIIGGADGPTSIFTANKLAPHLLAPIAVAAYSYMSLVPLIQPPIMRALTTPAERRIRMSSLRKVSKVEKLAFALVVCVITILLVPAATSLLAMLFLGNFLRETGVTERLVQASQNEIINVVTIFLGVSVGLTMTGDRFLQAETLKIVMLGVVAFGASTAGGVLMAKFMNLFLKQKINPLIGSAGVSAVPMAARVSEVEGQKADPQNHLLFHAMGPNVAGVIGTAIVAGYLISGLAK